VPPTVVVPLAERSHLINEIGLWVLEQACPNRRRWQSGMQTVELTLSVNVSARQLMSPDFVATVASVLSNTDTDPKLVTLDMTESVFVQDSERALVVLNELKHLGVTLALDDFGTGYASLNYLRRFPIDIVKIDREFVAGVTQDTASHAIVFAVVELVHMLGMTAVAEGVETAEQRQELASLSCDSCQGYYFARPMSADALDTLMQQHDADGAVRLPSLAAANA
jgi:EAL domain-containing protein (putative c-di-GMP-specific phosphodiesterase class I)